MKEIFTQTLGQIKFDFNLGKYYLKYLPDNINQVI